jgi:hypothetical protein
MWSKERFSSINTTTWLIAASGFALTLDMVTLPSVLITIRAKTFHHPRRSMA